MKGLYSLPTAGGGGGGGGATERTIASEKTVHSEIVQHKRDLPSELGSILWCALARSDYSVYLPFYSGITSIPREFNRGEENLDYSSAFWIIKNFEDNCQKLPAQYRNKLLQAILKFERKIMSFQEKIEQVILKLYQSNKKAAIDYLNNYLRDICENHIKLYETLSNEASQLISQ